MPTAPGYSLAPARREGAKLPHNSSPKTTPIVMFTPRADTRSCARLSPRPAFTNQSARNQWQRTEQDFEAGADKPEGVRPSTELQELPPQPQRFQSSPTAPTPIPPLAGIKRKRTKNSEAETVNPLYLPAIRETTVTAPHPAPAKQITNCG